MRASLVALTLILILAAAGQAGHVVQAVGRQSKAGLGVESARFVAEVRAARSVRAQAAALAANSAPDLPVDVLAAASLATLSPHILYVRLYGQAGETGVEAAAGCEVDAAALAAAARALSADRPRLARLAGLWRAEGSNLEVLSRAGKGAGEGELKRAVKGLKRAAGEMSRLADLASADHGKTEETMK